MRTAKRLLAQAALLCLFPAAAYAGAWTQDSGHGILIQTASYYYTSAFFDETGKRQPMAAYQKEELNPYAEYGLRDGLTVGANLSLQRIYQGGNPPQQSWGLGDSEFFVRQRLWQGDGFIFSAEPMVKLPSPAGAKVQPRLGGNAPDAGLTLSGGYGFKAWGLDHFVDIDAGARHRFGVPKDQLRLNATAGVAITKQWTLLPQAFLTMRTGKPRTALFTQSSGDDYNLTKLQLSALYKWDDTLGLQFGGFSNVAGRNAGDGDGLLIAVWKNF